MSGVIRNPYLRSFIHNGQYPSGTIGGVSVIPTDTTRARNETFIDEREFENIFFDQDRQQGRLDLTPEELQQFRLREPRDEIIFSQTRISYINIDSSQRRLECENEFIENPIQLPPYPLFFTNDSEIITVSLPDHTFNVGDTITLDGVTSKNNILNNPLSIKKNSRYARINHPQHGLSLFGLFDDTDEGEFIPVEYIDSLPTSFNSDDNIPDNVEQLYLLRKNFEIDFKIKLTGIRGSNITRTMIGNIPINSLNRKQTVFLIFRKNGTVFQSDPDNYLVMLEKMASINYRDGMTVNNTVCIKFCNLYGIPLNYLNFGTPINQDRKFPNTVIIATAPDTFDINVNYRAIVDPNNSFYNLRDIRGMDVDSNEIINDNRGGGMQCFVRLVSSVIPGFPNPNNYVITLDRSYKNVVQARIIGSVFPNSERIINDNPLDVVNNRLYWRNLDDGEWIYFLEVTPGNYTAEELAAEIERQFSMIPRFQYTVQFSEGLSPEIVEEATLLDQSMFDDMGFNKFHTVRVDICEETDIVSFSFYREIVRQDSPNKPPVLSIPDSRIEFTMAENLGINFGRLGTGIVNLDIIPFNPSIERLFIYFTENSHIRINKDFPFAYKNLYRYIEHVLPDTINTNGFNTFLTEIETNIAILFNFYRNKGIYPDNDDVQEINSLNTSTILNNFDYNSLTNTVFMADHGLKIGDLIVTDQFINPINVNQIYVYEVTNVVDIDTFRVNRFGQGTGVKFIYDSIIINFGTNIGDPTDAYWWLDQILASDPITSINAAGNNNTLSITQVNPGAVKKLMIVNQPNHQLDVGDEIIIGNSNTINGVPPEAINKAHVINRIIDDDNYQVLLGLYMPIENPETFFPSNLISIKYPDSSQMFFNFNDTLGNILSFNKVGQPVAITPYRHVIRNIDPYENDFNLDSLGVEYREVLKKLNLKGEDYFYIVIPELSYFRNTEPVDNVFAKIRWIKNNNALVIDTFVPSVKTFDSLAKEINQLTVSIVKPNGRPVEFNGRNHSFTIQIVEVFNQSEQTDISSRINSTVFARRVS